MTYASRAVHALKNFECGYAWGEHPAYGGDVHHDCAQPAGHDDDHVCGTCGRSRENTTPPWDRDTWPR